MTRSGPIGRTLSRTISAVRAMDHGTGGLPGPRRILVDACSPLSVRPEPARAVNAVLDVERHDLELHGRTV